MSYKPLLKNKDYNWGEYIKICQADTGVGVCCQAAEEGGIQFQEGPKLFILLSIYKPSLESAHPIS
jgi:hypothetical protein